MLKNNRFARLLCVGVLLLLLTTHAQAQTAGCGRLYVDSAVTTSGNGSSWATALKTVSQALDSANSGSCSSREIWVAKGTYYPMSSATAVATSRDSSFRVLRNGIKLYGGFAGTETTLSARNVATNVTALSGDIGIANDSSDNCYHVVTVVSSSTIDSNTIIDGLTIKKGNAGGLVPVSLSLSSYCTFSVAGQIICSYTGGGLCNIYSSPVIKNCTFTSNSSNRMFDSAGLFNNFGSGGGMHNRYSSPSITDCTFSFNSSDWEGGGMTNIHSSPSITNCTFSSNRAGDDQNNSGNGGGMSNGYSSPSITDCTFTSNSSRWGGGMYNITRSLPTITNCTFTSNSAINNGGGMFNGGTSIYYSSSAIITNCTFTSNSSGYNGGGMSNGFSDSLIITNCTFSSNSSSNQGGGMYNDSAAIRMRNCTFTSNSSLYFGGGMYNKKTSSSSITNCVFSSNTSNNGAGIYNSTSSPAVTNCLFYSNTGYQGGGMHNSSSSPSITNCTFSSNAGINFGGSIYNDASSPTIKNAILWGNTSGSGASIYNASSASGPVVSYSITETTQSGTGNSTSNPLFVNTANAIGPDSVWRTSDDGLQLQGGSPAINTGDNAALSTGITTDITGATRIRQTIVDMGAYESTPFSCPSGTIVYVDSSKVTSGDGSSWANAYRTVSQGLYAAHNCASVTEVWVAKGIYYPMASATAVAGNRDSSFRILRNGIKLYGGFAGTETMLSARNVATNPTVLSGDIGLVGDSSDNCYHVLTVVSNNTIDTSTRIDGFTVRRGNANASGTFTIAGKALNRQHGGGMYNSSSLPMITNCTFSSNNSISSGGGMFNDSASLMITNCIFSSNRSDSGGGMHNKASSPSITNCIFTFNNSSSNGGGMWNSVASPAVTNCTFAFNSSSSNGGGIYNANSSPLIANCILWGNTSGSGASIYNTSSVSSPVISYTTTETTQTGTGNSTANPLFVNAANAIGPDGFWRTSDDGLRLTPCSPAINTGSNAAVPTGITTDITGATRILNTTVDKGTYEMPYNATGLSSTTIAASTANPVCGTTSITFTATTLVPGSMPAYQWKKNGVNVGSNQTTYTSNSWSNGDSVWVVHTNNDCGLNDSSAKIIVQLVPVPAQPGTIAGSTSPCPGTQTYSVTALPGATTYTWTVPAGWTITAGQGTTSVTVTSTNMAGNVTVTANNSCGVASAVRTLVTTTLAPPTTPAGPAAVCASSTGNVYSTTVVLGATTYTWTVPAGWVITAGQGTTSVTVTAAAGNTSGSISVNAGDGCQTSSGATLAVSASSIVPSLTVGSNSGSTICQGTLVTFTAAPTNGGTAPSYQWKQNGVNVGTNSTTYSTSTLATGDVVTVTLTPNITCASVPSVTASGPAITVTPSVMPAISINGTSPLILCVGASNTFTATSSNGGAAPTYQWYKNGIAIAGATSSSYTGSAFTNNDSISVVLTSNAICRLVDTVRSSSVKMAVYPNVAPTLIVGSNSGDSICAGTTVVFTAAQINGGTTSSYQWKKNGVNVGTNSTTYSTSTLVTGDVISVTLTFTSPCVSVPSVTATGPPITVVPSVMPAVSINGTSTLILCAGASHAFTANSTAGGAAPTYRWYKNGAVIPGATAASYTGSGFATNDVFSVVLISTAKCRTVDTVRSNGVVVTVNPNVVPVLTVTANPGTSVPTGATVTFTATITAGGSSATYQWLKNGNAIAGATNSTYTTNTLQKGDLISVQVAALGPCATPNTLTSAPLQISGPAGIHTIVGGGNWQESLLLHPNPSSGRFTLSADWGAIAAGEKVQVNIVNALGQSVFSSEVIPTAGKWNLDIQLTEGVANGLYMLRLQRRSNGSSAAIPVLIQR